MIGPLFIALVGLILPGTADAHSRSRSFSIWTIEPSAVQLYLELDKEDLLESVFVDVNRDGELTQREALSRHALIAALLEDTVEVQGTLPCTAVGDVSVEIPDPPHQVFLRQRWTCLGDDGIQVGLFLHEKLADANHRNLANFKFWDGRHAEYVFGRNRTRFVLPSSDGESTSSGPFAAFLELGFEHILGGYDHLLFLFALLLVWPTWPRLLAMITAFTIAHSITLTAAILGPIALPTAWIEIAIGATIAWVAAENILREAPAHRSAAAFCFGLIHGLGFANGLMELDLATARLVGSMFAFNLGVELGQCAVVIPTYVFLGWLTPRLPWDRVQLRCAFSVPVLVAGTFWVVSRAFAV